MSRGALVLLGIAVVALVVADQWLAPSWPASDPPDLHVVALDEAAPPVPEDWRVLVDLAGTWDFRIGDAAGAAGGEWDRIAAPAAWEDQGYHGYDGVAWYRTTFATDAAAAEAVRQSPAHLLLGRIDDVDEVWLNGVRVGESGHFPPDYRTASFGFRTYRLPPGLLQTEKPNELVVRVFDAGLEGGILEGPLALAVPTPRNPAGVPVVADLAGTWRFSPGDGDWAAPGLDDARWDSLLSLIHI